MSVGEEIGALHPIIHAPARLQICAILNSVDEAEYAKIRETINVSESVLSKHIKLLEGEGIISVKKIITNSRNRTWLKLTSKGKNAFEAHVKELKRLMGDL